MSVDDWATSLLKKYLSGPKPLVCSCCDCYR